jgi:hypothetical protein
MIREWGAERYLLYALQAAEAIFPFPVPETKRFGDWRSRWAQQCLQLAGINRSLIDHRRPQSSTGRITSRLFRETFWDLTFRRPPRRARESISDYLAALAARFGRAGERRRALAKDDG